MSYRALQAGLAAIDDPDLADSSERRPRRSPLDRGTLAVVVDRGCNAPLFLLVHCACRPPRSGCRLSSDGVFRLSRRRTSRVESSLQSDAAHDLQCDRERPINGDSEAKWVQSVFYYCVYSLERCLTVLMIAPLDLRSSKELLNSAPHHCSLNFWRAHQ